MGELLSRHTSMALHRVEHGMPLEPGSIYLIPPKKNLAIAEDKFLLSDQDLSRGHPLNFPIDIFLNSLAESLGERAIGVVLSGTGSDGTRGVRAINEAGGVVLVQDPETAEFDGMPRSVIGTGMADYVLRPRELARAIYDYVTSAPGGLIKSAAKSDLDTTLQEITAILARDQRIDFSHYKPSTLGASHRAAARDRRSQHPRRVHAVVGRFGRGACRPAQRSADQRDRLFPRPRGVGVSRAADHSPADRADEGVRRAACLGHGLLQRGGSLFAGDAGAGGVGSGWQVDGRKDLCHRHRRGGAGESGNGYLSGGCDRGHQPAARGAVLQEKRAKLSGDARAARDDDLRPAQLARDPPFTRMHLVTCRNLLIYMQPELQHQVLSTLHFALQPKGVLFLGAAESVGDLDSEFTTLHQKWKVFEKKRDVKLPLRGGEGLLTRALHTPRVASDAPDAALGRRLEAIASEAFGDFLRDQKTLCLLATPDHELLQVFGDSRNFLRVPEGKAPMDVTRLVPRPLSLPLSTALHRARMEKKAVAYSGIKIEQDHDARCVDLHVTYHAGGNAWPEFLMILFKDAGPAGPVTTDQYDVDSQSAQRITDLENDLQQTKENLQATIEELETTNEEQQATNEEMLASNEELQSTNEELQSVNEELYSVNAEYQSKIQELIDLNNDMDNLLSSTDIGTVFLDNDLQIRKFTPAVTEVIKLQEHDVGRPIDQIALRHRHGPRRVACTGQASAGNRRSQRIQCAESERCAAVDACQPLSRRGDPNAGGRADFC